MQQYLEKADIPQALRTPAISAAHTCKPSFGPGCLVASCLAYQLCSRLPLHMLTDPPALLGVRFLICHWAWVHFCPEYRH